MSREKQLTYQGAEKKNVNSGAETGFIYLGFRLIAVPIASAMDNLHLISSLIRLRFLRAGPKSYSLLSPEPGNEIFWYVLVE